MVIRNRRTVLDYLKNQMALPEQDDLLSDLIRRIRQDKLIPIIASSVRGDSIFEPLFRLGEEEGAPENSLEEAESGGHLSGDKLTVDSLIAQAWAEALGYPFLDYNRLARVAQYNLIKSVDEEQAKTRYIDFLKGVLLTLAAAAEGKLAEAADELRGQTNELSFSDLADELELPVYTSYDEDPLRLLARLPLSIYLTTSYYDFMERALVAEGRPPRTQICFWQGEPPTVRSEHRTDFRFRPSPEKPVVYHILGFEQYPNTLVLSEDDYLNFLIRVAQPIDKEKPIIPLYLVEALAESSLLLLGYHIQDWAFQTLFRGIITTQQNQLRLFSLAIQLEPSTQEGIQNIDEARRYLEKYFEPSHFKVEWGDADSFVRKLWREWDASR